MLNSCVVMLKLKRPYDKVELYFNTLRSICSAEIRPAPKTYYEILNLKEDCSSKEVRDAFIKLSKQIHPDKNFNEPLNHQRFVKINEAYSVLSRPQKRSAYDLSLRNKQQTQRAQTTYSTRPASQYNTTYTDFREHYNFWKSEQNHSQHDSNEHQRLSKSWIVFLCIMFASAGVGLQILLIRKSLTFSREKLDKMSEENSRILADVRRQASENSLEQQLELMKQRMERSVNQYNQSKRTDK